MTLKRLIIIFIVSEVFGLIAIILAVLKIKAMSVMLDNLKYLQPAPIPPKEKTK